MPQVADKPKESKPKRRFLLKSGIHVELTYTPATPEQINDDRIQVVFRRGEHVIPGDKTYYPGDVIETDEDLLKFNANSVTPKFEEILEPDYPQALPYNPWNDLEGKTVEQLKHLALAEEIDLGDAKTKADIITRLREAVSS